MDQATQAVLRVARSVLERLDLEIVLERVIESARELTGARYAAVGVLNESRTGLQQFLTVGIDESTRRLIGPLPGGRGVLGELIRDPQPLRLKDVGSHPYSYGFPVGHPPMSSFLGVPILVDGRPYGNLYLTEKRDGAEFSAEDEQAAVLLAEFAGIAIDHAKRFTGSETQRLALERTVNALDATLQIARALSGQTEISPILELVAKRGRALVSARALVIELLVGDELELAAGAGELPIRSARTSRPGGEHRRQRRIARRSIPATRRPAHPRALRTARTGPLGSEGRRRAGRAADVPRAPLRGAGGRRPSRAGDVHSGAPEPARRVCGQRRSGRRDGAISRRRTTAPAARGRRG